MRYLVTDDAWQGIITYLWQPWEYFQEIGIQWACILCAILLGSRCVMVLLLQDGSKVNPYRMFFLPYLSVMVPIVGFLIEVLLVANIMEPFSRVSAPTASFMGLKMVAERAICGCVMISLVVMVSALQIQRGTQWHIPLWDLVTQAFEQNTISVHVAWLFSALLGTGTVSLFIIPPIEMCITHVCEKKRIEPLQMPDGETKRKIISHDKALRNIPFELQKKRRRSKIWRRQQ